MWEAPTFRAATNTQKSDELESTSTELSFRICCNSEPKKVNSIRYYKRKAIYDNDVTLNFDNSKQIMVRRFQRQANNFQWKNLQQFGCKAQQ
jgi:hypothetical protein